MSLENSLKMSLTCIWRTKVYLTARDVCNCDQFWTDTDKEMCSSDLDVIVFEQFCIRDSLRDQKLFCIVEFKLFMSIIK